MNRERVCSKGPSAMVRNSQGTEQTHKGLFNLNCSFLGEKWMEVMNCIAEFSKIISMSFSHYSTITYFLSISYYYFLFHI